MLPPSLRLLALAAAFALAAPAASAKHLNDITFHIKKGHHDASNGGVRVHVLKMGKAHNRRVSFKVLFPGNVPYQTANVLNQGDSNKVMGLSIGRIHEDSVRLGWAWDPQTKKIQLRYYTYFNGTRDNRPLLQVPLNQWTQVELKMSNSVLSVRAGAAFIEKPVNLGWKGTTITAVLRTAYFGGDEKAPHNLDIQVKDIDAD